MTIADRKRSLASIVAAGLVAVTTLLAGIYSLFDYDDEKRQMAERLHALARLQIHEIRVALEQPVWNIDRPQIEKVIEAMALPQWVYGVRVTAAGKTYGRERDAGWKLVPWRGTAVPAGLMVYDEPIVFNGNRIGDARLFISTHLLEADLRALRQRLIGTVILIDVVLVLAVYLLMSRLVLRPVQAIERYAAAVSGGAEGDPPPASARARELSNLQQSIETMVRQLQLREDRFHTIFESVNDAILVRDAETGAVVDANERTCELFGYTREELRTLGYGGLSSGQGMFNAETAKKLITSAGRETAIFEWQARRRDGSLFWVEVNMRLADIGGEERVIMVGRDTTQRREMEQALRVSERMSAIGSLVAGVAHEVRNPLFGISATLDAFEAEFGANADTADYMTNLRRDVARLTRLMNDLLEYAQPRRGIERHAQLIGPVIEEAVRVCTQAARDKQVQIDPHVAADLPRVAIDAGRLVQVLTNVIENAIAFTAAGGTIAVDVGPEQNGSSRILLSVSDEGPGFREADLPRVFEPFFSRRRGGSGLGLAIAEKIVSEHGGQIAALNTPRGGSIEIRLPAAQ